MRVPCLSAQPLSTGVQSGYSGRGWKKKKYMKKKYTKKIFFLHMWTNDGRSSNVFSFRIRRFLLILTSVGEIRDFSVWWSAYRGKENSSHTLMSHRNSYWIYFSNLTSSSRIRDGRIEIYSKFLHFRVWRWRASKITSHQWGGEFLYYMRDQGESPGFQLMRSRITVEYFRQLLTIPIYVYY